MAGVAFTDLSLTTRKILIILKYDAKRGNKTAVAKPLLSFLPAGSRTPTSGSEACVISFHHGHKA